MLFIYYVFDDVASKFYVFNKYGSAEMAKNLVDGQGWMGWYDLNKVREGWDFKMDFKVDIK